MTITADDFRALARSSPWLWRSIEFVWNGGPRVWMQRPARCVIDDGFGLRQVSEEPGDGSWVLGWDDGQPVVGAAARAVFGEHEWECQAEPVRRPDGLVAQRPHGELLSSPSQPMVEGYFSVAALDPLELAESVDLHDVRVETFRGRESWVARCVPLEDYEPRCGCCALLPDLRIALLEWGEQRAMTMSFPDDVEIWLDRATGVMTRWIPNGGDRDRIEVEIVVVDGDFDSVWERATPEPDLP